MNLEQNIKDCIQQEIDKGVIEKAISANLEKCVNESISDMFRWNGCIKEQIDKQLREVMIPYLENYDFSQLVPKLDLVMTETIKELTVDRQQIINNFKNITSKDDIQKEMNLSDLFEKWTEYCQNNIDTSNLEDYDYEGAYINCIMSTQYSSPSWSSRDKYTVTFECEEDKDLNVEFELYKWHSMNDEHFTLSYDTDFRLSSIKNLDKFEILMLKLKQNDTKIILDSEDEFEEVFIEYEA